MIFKLFPCRHYSSLLSSACSNSKASQVIRLCKAGLLSEGVALLNTIDSRERILSPALLYAALVQACITAGSFKYGLQFHSHAIKTALESDRYVANILLAFYFKLGSNYAETRRFFDGMVYRDVISWTSMLSMYVQMGKPKFSLDLYREMVDLGIEPNEFSLSCVIKACSELGELKLGCCFHGIVVRRGFNLNDVIASALIDMYGRTFQSTDSRKVFVEMHEPDAICWTSIISALTRCDCYDESLSFFYMMNRSQRLVPDGYTFGSVITACGNLGRLRQSKEVHAKVVTGGFSGNVIVESSLVDMYAKCGLMNESQCVFDGMRIKNSVSWCALLGGYCQKDNFDTVIELFRIMKEVDLYSFGIVLRACAGLAAVRPGKELHCQYLRRGGWRNVIVESALVHLYAKCGCVDFAHNIFIEMPVKNLITWNSMIVGFAQNGMGQDAIEVFAKMTNEDVEPDYISFIGVLFACSHSGFVDEGRRYFISMTRDYRIEAGSEHYSCMVDLLGRAGEIEEAETLIMTSNFKNDPSLWSALLGACTSSTKPIVAERIAKRMMQLKPNYHLSYVLLGNVYRAVGRWSDALTIWEKMESIGIKKMPGKSWM